MLSTPNLLKIFMLYSPKSFGQQICLLLLCPYVTSIDLTIFDLISHKVAINLYLCCPLLKYRIGCRTALLSQNTLISYSIEMPHSVNNPSNHTTFVVAVARPLYPASAELLDTVSCFLDFHDTNDSLSIKNQLLTFWYQDMQPSLHHKSKLDCLHFAAQ